jgi:hypothetical protein
LQQPQFGALRALVNGVLRITATSSDKVVLKLEGRLVGPWVDELKTTVLQTNASSLPLEIDVSGLTFADDEGEKALSWLHRMGAHFQGKGLFTKCLFERLKIPLFSRQTKSDGSTGKVSG